jgi:hypothetical protein
MKVIHFFNAVIVACGRLRNFGLTTNNPRKVTCKNCKKTKANKEATNDK